ncbi:glycosyltransferase family 1 protein [uncultured Clostridium sp.]|uniref:glycosyltransferase family 4 protein n=1 Tax=uncultured Clostridium sp. TaxID=59620 RepID=UPI002622ED9B|nr:glycosyltransferase family 1 protein [uncultured Clostridium sp.]
MKIAIDSRSVNLHSGTGIGTYTNNLVSEMINIDTLNDFTLIWTGSIIQKFKKSNTRFIHSSGKHGRFFENHFTPKKLLDNDIDLYHIPQNGIGFPFEYNINTVVTIHDLIPYIMPETVGRGYLNRFLKDMPKIIENSKGIFTVSEFSKRDILRFFKGYPEDKIFVTPLATNKQYKPLDKSFCKNVINHKFKFTSPYILYIGGFSSRKNVKSLIDAFLNIEKSLSQEVKLLIVGPLKDEGEILYNYVQERNKLDSIIFTGFVDNDLLPILYNGAETFAYPSTYEGFGLPPLEAMSCKTAVLTSDITSIPEVTGDCATLINPYDINDISTSLFKILEDSSFRLSIANKGYEKSKEFSWKNTANLTLNAYKTIYDNILLK